MATKFVKGQQVQSGGVRNNIFTIQVLGLRQLSATFRKAADQDLPKRLTEANRKVAELVASRAQALAPVGSTRPNRKGGRQDNRMDPHPGRFRASIKPMADTRGALVRGGAGVDYFKPVHFGWPAREIPRNMVIYEALDASRDDAAGMYSAGIEELVRSMAHGGPAGE